MWLLNEKRHITGGIFYCRDSAKIKRSSNDETSYQLDNDVLRNRQQKHTAKPSDCLKTS